MTRGMDYATLDALRQIDTGRESDPQKRLTELQVRRDAVDAEIRRILAGEIALLDATALKDRFQQFMQTAGELLGDFREVEHNFRWLDRKVRERIALWAGSKGACHSACYTSSCSNYRK